MSATSWSSVYKLLWLKSLVTSKVGNFEPSVSPPEVIDTNTYNFTLEFQAECKCSWEEPVSLTRIPGHTAGYDHGIVKWDLG